MASSSDRFAVQIAAKFLVQSSLRPADCRYVEVQQVWLAADTQTSVHHHGAKAPGGQCRDEELAALDFARPAEPVGPTLPDAGNHSLQPGGDGDLRATASFSAPFQGLLVGKPFSLPVSRRRGLRSWDLVRPCPEALVVWTGCRRSVLGLFPGFIYSA